MYAHHMQVRLLLVGLLLSLTTLAHAAELQPADRPMPDVIDRVTRLTQRKAQRLRQSRIILSDQNPHRRSP